MRLKSDERDVLAWVAGKAEMPASVPEGRIASILRKFQSNGMTDAIGQLTPSGQHVASKYSRGNHADVPRQTESRVDGRTRSGDSGRSAGRARNQSRESGIRSTGNTEDGPSEAGGSDPLPVQGSDSGTQADAERVREEPAVPIGRDDGGVGESDR